MNNERREQIRHVYRELADDVLSHFRRGAMACHATPRMKVPSPVAVKSASENTSFVTTFRFERKQLPNSRVGIYCEGLLLDEVSAELLLPGAPLAAPEA